MQVCGRSNAFQIIGINGIAGIIRGFDPLPLFLLVRQAPGILNHVSCRLQKHGFGIAVFILRCIIDADKLTAGVGIRFLYNRLNFQRPAIGDIGGQLTVYCNGMSILASLAFRGPVTAAHDCTAMGSGAAGQGMVELEVNVVQKVAVGFRLISRCRGILISHRYEAEQRIRLAGRNGIQIILAQIHGGAAAAAAAARAAPRVGAIGVPGIWLAGVLASFGSHNPDVPLLGIDGAGGQAEGVVACVICKRTLGGEFFAVNGVLLRFGTGGNSITNVEPVHHLHELIPTILAGLGGVDALLGADDQRHDIFAVSRAMVKTPFVNAGRIGFDILVQRAFLVRVQLCGIETIRRC